MRLALNPDKTFSGVQRGVLLRYVVSEKGREPDPDKIAVIDGLATPTNVKGIAKLLGHVRWYRELIPVLLRLRCPLLSYSRRIVNLFGLRIVRECGSNFLVLFYFLESEVRKESYK